MPDHHGRNGCHNSYVGALSCVLGPYGVSVHLPDFVEVDFDFVVEYFDLPCLDFLYRVPGLPYLGTQLPVEDC